MLVLLHEHAVFVLLRTSHLKILNETFVIYVTDQVQSNKVSRCLLSKLIIYFFVCLVSLTK